MSIIIHRLPLEVSNTIAAGEVIERPMSVVKELVDNALDARATRIAIELQGGGTAMIRIEDDGSGIPTADLPISVENFSTSKIRSAEDIAGVRTLGFRGEALASIRTVSRLTIASRFREEEIGRRMEWHGGRIITDEPCARNAGTEVIVKDLFYNLPARRAFAADAASERRRIASLVQTFAIAAPRVAFTLREGGSDILAYPPSSLRERVEAILGHDVFSQLKQFERSAGRMEVHGFASLPQASRTNRSHQFLFVNGRSVRDRMISHAVRQAYQSLIPNDRFPVFVLFLDIPPEELDINVHPSKAEIRFRRQRDVHRFVATALRETLRDKTISFQEKVESIYRNIFPTDGPTRSAATGDPERDARYPLRGAGARESGPPEGGWNLHEAPLSLFADSDASAFLRSGGLYWQLHQSFILIQIRSGMVIVDQHAAHERVLFDAARRSLGDRTSPVQSLLFPATLELTVDEYERFETLSGVFPGIGFEIEPFGLRSVIVRGIPAGARNWDEGRLLQEILRDEGTRRGDPEELLRTYACKAAIKAGTKLSAGEMEALADQLFATEFPFTCPHGRPTMLRIGLADLERRFLRSVSSES